MRCDLILLHPPSIYDFRKRNIVAGPISELVPSTGVFEMYPIGFLSMLSYLTDLGFKVRIDNVALKMLSSARYNFEEELLKFDAEYIGIDLHWLPHVHGAINIARTIKKIRPDIKVILGGYSATYYSTEIMNTVKEVDYVIRGDTTEIPLSMILSGKNPEEIPNIIYRDGLKPKDNGFTFLPDNLDYQKYDYSYIMRSALRNMDLKGHLPYCNWVTEPVAMVITTHGCSYNCAICGGSNFAFRNFYHRPSPIFRSSKKIVEDLLALNNDFKIPAFIVGDILLRPRKEREFIFSELKREGLDIPLLFEVFIPHSREDLEPLVKSSHDVSIEISPDSSSDDIRFKNGRPYKNDALERFVSNFLELGGKKIDVYFLIGLSNQTRNDALNDIEYAKKLMKINKLDRRLFVFTSPVSPFLDPGSRGFENPALGYKLRFRTLMDHYNALDKGHTWADFLNYETQWMSRMEIVNTTYDAIEKLLDVRAELGIEEHSSVQESKQILEASRLAVNLAANGDLGLMKSGGSLIKDCGSKYTILKKEILWGAPKGGTRKLIFMFYRYLSNSRS